MSARTILLTVLSVTALGPHALQAQDAGAMEVRVYPVADIVRSVPDYPYRPGLPTSAQDLAPVRQPSGKSGGGFGGGYGGGGGGFGQIMDGNGLAARSTSSQLPADLDSLINVIRTSIASASWSNFGGEATIVALGTTLIVRQTADIHKEIQMLLQALSQMSGHQTMVTIRAFLLSPESAAEIESWKALLREQRQNPAAPSKALAELERGAKDLGQISCFSGQQVHLAAGKRRNIVSSAIPVVSAYAVAYQPQITSLHIGTLLEFTATVDPGGRSAMLDVRCTVTDWNEAGEPLKFTSEFGPGKASGPAVGGTIIGAGGGGGTGGGGALVGGGGFEIGGGRSEATVERVNLDTQQLATTVRVPVSAEGAAPVPVIVGTLGQTSPAAGQQNGQAGLSYLVIAISQ